MILQKIQKKKGFVILFAVTVSSLLLAIALGVMNIAYKEVKFGTNAKDTNDAFFAADTGIECAFLNDKSTSNSFVSGTAKSFQCVGNTASTTPLSADSWSFTVYGLGSAGQGCAKVTVDKTNPILTTITSKGYNDGGSSCTQGPNSVEREIVSSY